MTQLDALLDVGIYLVGGVFLFGLLWIAFKLLTGRRNDGPNKSASVPSITLPGRGTSQSISQKHEAALSGAVTESRSFKAGSGR
jgi:hypothetical protein